MCGLQSDAPIRDKYRDLIAYIKESCDEQVLVVDASKSLEALKILLQGRQHIWPHSVDFSVVLMMKDVRSFTASIYRKVGAQPSLLNYLKTFNWWLSVNRRLLNYLEDQKVPFVPVLYERLCNEPEKELQKIFDTVGVEADDKIELGHANSHIAMGNKNFIMRNSDRIRYDNRWFLEDGIQAAYLLHRAARKFNRQLYAL